MVTVPPPTLRYTHVALICVTLRSGYVTITLRSLVLLPALPTFLTTFTHLRHTTLLRPHHHTAPPAPPPDFHTTPHVAPLHATTLRVSYYRHVDSTPQHHIYYLLHVDSVRGVVVIHSPPETAVHRYRRVMMVAVTNLPTLPTR